MERLSREAGEPREVGMQQGDRAELESRRWQEKCGILVALSDGRKGIECGKAEGQNLHRQKKNWGQVETGKGRSLYWRMALGKKQARAEEEEKPAENI